VATGSVTGVVPVSQQFWGQRVLPGLAVRGFYRRDYDEREVRDEQREKEDDSDKEKYENYREIK